MFELVLTPLSASLLTLALVAAGARLKPGVALRWLRSPVRIALPVLALVISAAGLGALPVGIEVDHPANAAASVDGKADDGPVAQPSSASDESRERAIQHLRDYAKRITDKKQTIALLGSDAAPTPETPSLPDVDTMLGRLVERLKTNPEDGNGWSTLAWAYANTGRISEAVTAYEKALALSPGNIDLKNALTEARRQSAHSATNGSDDVRPQDAAQGAAVPSAAN